MHVTVACVFRVEKIHFVCVFLFSLSIDCQLNPGTVNKLVNMLKVNKSLKHLNFDCKSQFEIIFIVVFVFQCMYLVHTPGASISQLFCEALQLNSTLETISFIGWFEFFFFKKK